MSESLQRATPIPSLEPMGSRRASGTLSVSSIAEEDTEEHDSATSLTTDRVRCSKGLPRPSNRNSLDELGSSKALAEVKVGKLPPDGQRSVFGCSWHRSIL